MEWIFTCGFCTTNSCMCQLNVQSWKLFAALPVSFMACQHILGCCTLLMIGFFPTALGLITVFKIVFHHAWVLLFSVLDFILSVAIQQAAGPSCCYHSPSVPCPSKELCDKKGYETGQFPAPDCWWSYITVGILVVNLGMLPQPAVKLNANKD